MKLPLPIFTSDIRAWATNLTAYLRVVEREIEVPGPKIVQLEYKQPNAKATTNGILMWDNVLNEVVVSYNGAWHVIAKT